MLTIDGDFGEGGGQILRSSLGLSLVTGQPVRIINLRARRRKPGLQRQHLTCVRAAAAIGDAEVNGAELGSSEVVFRPRTVRAGEHCFAIGTAGSTTLVVQTVLPALLTASDRSTLVVEGGTHNMLAPPFDFFAGVFLPLVERMGPRVTARLERHGFHPAGGGRLVIEIEPVPRLRPIEIMERGRLLHRRGTALVAGLPRSVGEREIATLGAALDWPASALEVIMLDAAMGPGNVVMAEVAYEHVSELASAVGERGRRAEEVARSAASELSRYLASTAPVGEHLADQLLLPLALAGGGGFRTGPPTLHTRTHIDIVQRFLSISIEVSAESANGTSIAIRG